MLGTARRPQVCITPSPVPTFVPKENTVPKKTKKCAAPYCSTTPYRVETIVAAPVLDEGFSAMKAEPRKDDTPTVVENHLVLDLADGKAPRILVNGVDIAPMADRDWSIKKTEHESGAQIASLTVTFSVVLP